MKSFNILLALLQVTLIRAAPAEEAQRVPSAPQPYKLRAISPGNPIDGKYFTLQDFTISIYGGLSTSTAAYKFYTTPGASSGTYYLHSYPIGIVDHAVTLVGTNGLSSIQDVVNPAATTWPIGTYAAWSEWTITPETGKPVTGQPKNLLAYKDAKGSRWVAFPGAKQGDFKVQRYDGTGVITADSYPLTIQVVRP